MPLPGFGLEDARQWFEEHKDELVIFLEQLPGPNWAQWNEFRALIARSDHKNPEHIAEITTFAMQMDDQTLVSAWAGLEPKLLLAVFLNNPSLRQRCLSAIKHVDPASPFDKLKKHVLTIIPSRIRVFHYLSDDIAKEYYKNKLAQDKLV